MPRITEAWGGNRQTNGSAWMELYYAIDIGVYDNAFTALTGNGKIPNQFSSVYCRATINSVFDANTLDNTNTFIQNGANWPGYNGSVSIPTVKERTIYTQEYIAWPAFDTTKAMNLAASLTGIDRIPGKTTSFNVTHQLPRRAWALPATPTITSYSLQSNNDVIITLAGHQGNPAADNYWQWLDFTILRETGWNETYGFAGNTVNATFGSLNPNSKYIIGARSVNEDAGGTPWSTWLNAYTKPSAPTATSAKRQTADPTKVDVKIVNNAAFPDNLYIERRPNSSGSWTQIATVAPSTTTYVDTYATGSQPEYRVRTRTVDGKTYSDYSGTVQADVGAMKMYIPGVVEMYLGSTKIGRVFWQDKEIWKS